jgi:hypothetical protein
MATRRSARIAPGLVATPQQDADLLSALLLGDVGWLNDVLGERGDAELGTWPQPLPLYHAAFIGGRAEAVAVLAAAGAPVDLAERDRLTLGSDVLFLLNQQLGACQTSILGRAAQGRQSAAALAAGCGRLDFLAALLEAGGWRLATHRRQLRAPCASSCGGGLPGLRC